MSIPSIIVSYHGGCPDGMGAALSAYRALGDRAIYLPVYHDRPFPAELQGNLASTTVYCLDYCPKQPDLLRLVASAREVIVLDHHDGVAERTADLFASGALSGKIDQQHSGAVLAWRWFHPRAAVPYLFCHVQDRDLWKWELPRSASVLAAVDSYPLDLQTWSHLLERVEHDPGSLNAEGIPILRFRQQLVDATAALARPVDFLGYSVLAANTQDWLASEVGHILAPDHDFSVCYHDLANGFRKFSLRSTPQGLNVREICEKLGGGGHVHAAGCQVALCDLNVEGMPRVPAPSV